MTPLEFALSLLISLMVFLAFAMTIATILLGSNKTKTEARKLFQVLLRQFLSYSSHRQIKSGAVNLQDCPKAVKQKDKSKV